MALFSIGISEGSRFRAKRQAAACLALDLRPFREAGHFRVWAVIDQSRATRPDRGSLC
jgi:hypothetical protein